MLCFTFNKRNSSGDMTMYNKMMRLIFLTAVVLSLKALTWHAAAQTSSYTSYFTGNNNDAVVQPLGGVCLMGGSVEDDNAMKWFLQRAAGGDVLVLRASGADGYNNYLYAELGVPVNSVETIVCHNAACATEPYIHQKIQKAEAIWFAGGDQWRYISYWRGTAIDSLIKLAVMEKNVVIGGTSAGMAILGGRYFSAQNGTITSATALANPFHSNMTVDTTTFIQSSPWLKNVITDTHYDNPVRKGRHVAFLARLQHDFNIIAYGIACNERTAVCISPEGQARVYGRYPQSASHEAYFLQFNCEVNPNTPEVLQQGTPLTWKQSEKAIKVYRAKGTPEGSNTFDLTTWQSGLGGTWEHWWVDNGMLLEAPAQAPECTITSLYGRVHNSWLNTIFPSPTGNMLYTYKPMPKYSLAVDALGKTYPITWHQETNDKLVADISHLPKNQVITIIHFPRTSTDRPFKFIRQ